MVPEKQADEHPTYRVSLSGGKETVSLKRAACGDGAERCRREAVALEGLGHTRLGSQGVKSWFQCSV